jgi:hypothetical protein
MSLGPIVQREIHRHEHRSMKAEAMQFTAAILRARLCARCISVRSDIVEDHLGSLIRSVRRTINVLANVDQCDGCGQQMLIYRLR